MIGILWGLLGALLIGLSDATARKTTQHVTGLVLIFFVMGISTVALTLHAHLTNDWPKWHTYAWAVSFISGILSLLALALLYKALSRGPVSVASPAAASFTIILVVINALLGQPFKLLHFASIVLVFIGIVMLTRPNKVSTKAIAQTPQYDGTWLRTTAYISLAAALTISLRFYLAQEASDILGATHSLYLNRAFSLIAALILMIFFYIQKRPLTWPMGGIAALVLLQSITEGLALWAFLIASTEGTRITATIGFSAFAASATFFAQVFYKEKVSTKNWLWIGVITLGIILGSL